MKATGIVRRIDDLGRVVIPKEIRRTQKIREGMPMEIYTNTMGEVILKKYSPVGEITSIAQSYADTLVRLTGMGVVVCDMEQVIVVSGGAKKELLNKNVSEQMEALLEKGEGFVTSHGNTVLVVKDVPAAAIMVWPIVSEGDVMGALAIIKREKDAPSISPEIVENVKLASMFLGRQLED